MAAEGHFADGGIRRRHSGQQEEVDRSRGHGLRTATHVVDDHDHSQRVRFSTDVNTPSSMARTKKRTSDEMVQGPDEGSAQSGSQTLKLDTRASAIMAGASVSGGPIVGSPTNLGSPSRSPTRRTPVSAYQSPKSRSRGLSLRSSLFTRNIDHRAMSGDSIIEMQPVGPSGQPSGRTQDTKKGAQPTVVVSPVPETLPMRPASQKEVQSTSALPNYRQWVEKQAHQHLPIRRLKELYETTRSFVLRIQEIPPTKDGRHIDLDPSRKDALIDERTGREYVSNLIRSSKYTPYNFVPRQLFAQFSKLANFYFLIVATLQMIPGLSTTGTYTTIVPLLFFVAISMSKEGYEDLRRHRLDKAENNRETKVLHAYRPTPGPDEAEQGEGLVHWASVKWQSLKVGDVVKLERDDAAPADIILLHSTGPASIAYVETMALDGETNLKSKQPAQALMSAYKTADSIAPGGARFTVEDPNLDLYNFEGKVAINDTTAPLTNNEIIYRGSVLRNTSEAIGMVIYSGEECKIRMNANKNPRIKAPSLQAIVNKIVMFIVCVVLFIAIFNTIAYRVWQTTENKAWYLTRASVPFGHVLVSFLIMLNTMIPLSLYVSMEIIKVAQMLLLNDIDMYDEESNTPLEAHTTTINEELGQVGYIFSDKTGTLTQNVMRFRKLSVAGTAWLHDADLKDVPEGEEMLLHKKRKPDKGKGKKRVSRLSSSGDVVATPTSAVTAPRMSTSQWTTSAAPGKPHPELSTAEMIRYIQRRPNTAFAERAKMLVLNLALCHTVLPERDSQNDKDISFQAASPDELALVQAARELGYLAYDRDISTLTLRTYPHGEHSEAVYESYQILDVIEFSSKRKRMSIIMRFPDGRICLMCKGADSVVMQRLRLASLANEKLAEVEDRVLKRKSMEADQALRRKSSHIEYNGSASNLRTSTSLARPSMSRPSIGRLGPIRDDVDGWLRDREQDVQSPVDAAHYSPRPSAQIGRPSVAPSDRAREASLFSEVEDELVEEALVLDDAAVMTRTFQHINDFATEGLRTLLHGHRFLDEEMYRSWKKVFHEASTSLVDRSAMVERAGELIEQDLELGGATAIEDKLQVGVPETIDRLRRASIKLWMLTGDKRETAINIGTSCRLIKDYSAVVVLDHEGGEVEQNIAASIIDINRGDVAHSVVVVDGQTLSMITADESLNALALDLFILADTVICCRASPSQKAGLVSAVRKRMSNSVTLAIGDGANDIAMIQEAHVGIGITGKEGLQAARTSDYAIAQFRFLTKLLLVHGRWNYIRTCKYIVGTFWKEMLFYLTQAVFQRYNGYTGTSLYESWSLSMFNTLFTSLVVIFLGIFEKDLHESTLIAVPELYTKGQRSAGFNFKVYFAWMFMAASEAMIVFFTMWALFGNVTFTNDNSLYAMGDLTFTACVVVIATKLQVLEQRNKSIMALIAWVLAVGGWFLWCIILTAIYDSATNPEYFVKGAFYHQFGRNPLWWLTLILIVSACLLYEMGVRALKCALFPTDVEIFQQLEQDLGVRKRFEEASAPWLQAGWQRGNKKSSVELAREAEEQKRREGEVQELLDNRPRVMEEGRG